MAQEQTFTVTSWNMWCYNNDPENLWRLVMKGGIPDVMILQEVSPGSLEYIETSEIRDIYPYQAVAVDHRIPTRFGFGKAEIAYLVILSKISFEGKPIKYVHKRTSGRTWFSLAQGIHECIEHHGIDISIKGVVWRIINVHIACATEFENKQGQIREVFRHFNVNGPTIIGGDFNITESPEWWHGFSYARRRWLHGPCVRDLLQQNPRELFSQMIAEQGLHDGFEEYITHPEDGLPLDTILVPDEYAGRTTCTMSDEIHGSDHKPIATAIAL